MKDVRDFCVVFMNVLIHSTHIDDYLVFFKQEGLTSCFYINKLLSTELVEGLCIFLK